MNYKIILIGIILLFLIGNAFSTACTSTCLPGCTCAPASGNCELSLGCDPGKGCAYQNVTRPTPTISILHPTNGEQLFSPTTLQYTLTGACLNGSPRTYTSPIQLLQAYSDTNQAFTTTIYNDTNIIDNTNVVCGSFTDFLAGGTVDCNYDWTTSLNATKYLDVNLSSEYGTSKTGQLFSVGDVTPPVTTFSSFQVAGTTDQNITLTCTDDNSGCKAINYNINNEGWNYIPIMSNTNLVSYWNFDEASGNLIDQVGSNDGTNANITYSQTGIIEDAYYYNGSTSTTNAGSPASLEPKLTGFSWGTWVNVDASLSADGHIMGKTSTLNWNKIKYRLDYLNTGTKFECGMGNTASGNIQAFTATITKGNWYHVACTFDGSYVYSYLNGVFQNKTSYTGSLVTNDTNFTYGYATDGSAAFKGLIDEAFFFDRNLSADDVSDLYNSGSGIPYPFNLASYNFIYSGVGDHNIQYFSTDNSDNNETTKFSYFPLFTNTVDQANSRIRLLSIPKYNNETITSWQWIVDGTNLTGTTDQNRYYSTQANLDLNVCAILNSTYSECKSVGTWDTINPTIDVNMANDSFGFVSDFNISWNMACYDNFSPINYKIIWANDGTNTTLYDSDDANASVYSSFLDLNQGQSATLTFTCTDDYNNEAIYTSDTYYAILFRLINEANGTQLTYADVNREFTIAKVYTLDGNFSYDFNATASSTATFFSPSEDLWFEFGYTDGTKINRQINFGVIDDQNIGICAPYYQTFYQQRFVANSAKTIIVKNNVSNCYIIAGQLAYVYDTGYSITTYTIPKPYYLYTYSNGVKTYLALLDGGVPTAYNIDAIEFSRSTFNLNIGADTVAFYPLKSSEGLYDTNTLQIYYLAYQKINDSLKLDIYNGSTLLWTYTELVEPDELLVNFYWGGLDINSDDVLELRITKTIDGTNTSTSYYFTTMGASYQNTVSNAWAAIIAVIFFLFGITLVSVNKAFGIFGIIICVISLFFVNIASGAWWINLLAGAFIILIMYIILMTKQTGGQLT